ncbi:hypothetical protein ASD46_01375 [Rhizobium sp. Root491]|uniref:hypothetical protein n=1 Tax=Rhizobium sp. Root491 TaxID=1736548 RepID=UPI000712E16B|nr:hypothetical protein [Rhizobium sp. Root491]KQY53128.1 hypothetical protein ASD46_01375 [Rhizobium sp. Root491]
MSRSDHVGGPVDRLELLGAIIDDERVRLIHIKTARHILKRYYQKHGNARASVSFLQQATGLTRGSVANATEDLVAWGYFTRVMGSGKRPTEYHPNFSVLQSPDATSVLPSQDETKSSVLQPQDEIVLRSQDAKSVSVLQPQEQTHLLVSATARDKVNISAAGTGSGLAAAPARASEDRVMTIVSSHIEHDEDEGSDWLQMELQADDGAREQYAVCVQSDEDQAMQERGMKRLERLATALGIDQINEPDDVVGKTLLLTASDDFLPLEGA